MVLGNEHSALNIKHDSSINQTKALFQIGYMTEHPNSGPVDQGKIATLAFGLAKHRLSNLNGRGLGFNSRPVHLDFF